MKDPRLNVFRLAVEGLIESLDATVRVARWNDAEAKPAPLLASAGKLVERLGTASRLAAGKFHGTAAEVSRVDAMCAVLKRLDAAYAVYRRDLEASERGTPSGADRDITAALETELAAASTEAAAWR
jgi:hypothetical protein